MHTVNPVIARGMDEMRSLSKPVKSTEAMAAAAAMPEESEGRVVRLCPALRSRSVGGELWCSPSLCRCRDGKVGVNACRRAGNRTQERALVMCSSAVMAYERAQTLSQQNKLTLPRGPPDKLQPSRAQYLKKKSIYVLFGGISLWSYSIT